MRRLLSISERARRLDAALQRFLGRRPTLARNLALLGFLLLAAVMAGGVVAASEGWRGAQDLVYAAADGSIVAVEPISGETRVLYEGAASENAPGEEPRLAFAPTTAGGSRWLAFSVLSGGREDADARADLYVVDPFREARARLTGAVSGEAFTDPALSPSRSRILAGRAERGAPPNVAVMPWSGSRVSLLDPAAVEGAAQILSAAWISDDALFAWRLASPETLSLVAHDLRERRRVTVYETRDEPVGPLSYRRDSNTVAFAERPRGAPLQGSRLKLLVGDTEMPLRGAGEDLGLYDPSPPAEALDGEAAVMYTDGKAWGVGLLDLESWSFRKTAVRVEPESRYPQVSPDGRFIATYDGAADSITVRRLKDGGLVRRVEGVQPPEAAAARLREDGFDAPPEASWFVPPSFAWRDLEEG